METNQASKWRHYYGSFRAVAEAATDMTRNMVSLKRRAMFDWQLTKIKGKLMIIARYVLQLFYCWVVFSSGACGNIWTQCSVIAPATFVDSNIEPQLPKERLSVRSGGSWARKSPTTTPNQGRFLDIRATPLGCLVQGCEDQSKSPGKWVPHYFQNRK